jgi:hypothetical protein
MTKQLENLPIQLTGHNSAVFRTALVAHLMVLIYHSAHANLKYELELLLTDPLGAILRLSPSEAEVYQGYLAQLRGDGT